VIALEGHGFDTTPGDPEVPVLQVPVPSWSCIRPGFVTLPTVDHTRTQPPLSCIMIARMNRGSTLVALETDWIAEFMSLISCGELLGCWNGEHATARRPCWAAHLIMFFRIVLPNGKVQHLQVVIGQPVVLGWPSIRYFSVSAINSVGTSALRQGVRGR
jgi:hypothetical protein